MLASALQPHQCSCITRYLDLGTCPCFLPNEKMPKLGATYFSQWKAPSPLPLGVNIHPSVCETQARCLLPSAPALSTYLLWWPGCGSQSIRKAANACQLYLVNKCHLFTPKFFPRLPGSHELRMSGDGTLIDLEDLAHIRGQWSCMFCRLRNQLKGAKK